MNHRLGMGKDMCDMKQGMENMVMGLYQQGVGREIKAVEEGDMRGK